MKLRKAIHWLGIPLLAVCLAPVSAGAQVKMTINDNFMPGSQLLFSDGNAFNHPTLGPIYVDWRLTDGDPCVSGVVKKDGFFFIWMNRGSDLGFECEENFLDPNTHRRYLLKFPDAVICTELALGDAPCEVRADRIRAEKLFHGKASETLVAFMFHLGGNSYSLDTAGDISGSGDTRTLTNTTRTATLRKFGFVPGTKTPGSTPVGSPFVFVFQLTVTRVVQ